MTPKSSQGVAIEIFLLLRKLEEKANCLMSVCIWRKGERAREGGEGRGTFIQVLVKFREKRLNYQRKEHTRGLNDPKFIIWSLYTL